MATKALEDALHRVDSWPEHAQEALAELALEIDREIREGKYYATAAELEGIDRGLKAADEGRIVDQAQIDALIEKHRPK